MKYWKYILLLVLTLVFTTCKEEEPTMMIATLEMENVTFDISYREVSIQGRMVTNATVQEMVMEYSTDSAFREVKQAPMSKVNPKSDEPIYQVKLQELNENNLYYIRSRAVNKYSSVASASQTFKTLAFHLPEVQTDSIMDISVSSATLYATLLDRGTDQAPQVGFCFADHPEVTMENGVNLSYPQLENKDSVTFAIELTQLQDNVTYYVRAYAQNVKGVAYGQEISFTTTEIVPPTLGEVMIPSLSISYTTAMVSCEVLDEGGAPVIERGVCYSTMPNPTVESTKVSSGSGLGSFGCNLNDLIDGKTYYVRAYAINSKGTGYSQETTFTTVAYGMPMVMTGEVTDVTYTAAKVKGNVTSGGGLDITERGICYSTSHNPTEKDQKVVSGSGLGEYTCSLSDLTEATTYYARAYATNNKGTAYGEEVTFTTPDYTIPTVTTTAATSLSYESATCGGVVTSDGDLMITERGICYSTQPNPTIMSDKVTKSGSVGVFTCTLQGLSDGVSYYFRAYATNAKGTGYGELMTFTTPAYGQPVVTTSDVTSITYTTAKAGGVVTGDGGKEVTERGVCYAVDKTPTIADAKLTNGKGIGSYTCSLTGLTAGTTYNVRAYATNSIGTTYGEMKTFTTPAYGAPIVSTSSITNISYTSANAGGEVTADGGKEVTERGICYSTSHNPTTANIKVVSGNGTGAFNCDLTQLSANTTYYVRAYATNIEGTSYGAEKSFTTKEYTEAVVKTEDVTNITYTTATCSGNVTLDGGLPILECGICYSTWRDNPIIEEDHVVSSNKAIGAFSCDLSDLLNGMTYHYRAYVTTDMGTSYGSSKVFNTLSYSVPTVTTSAVSNISFQSATCGGDVTDDGETPVLRRGVCYATTPNPTIDYPVVEGGSGKGSFTCDIENLEPNKTYYVRAFAVNIKGAGYGVQRTFTTKELPVPSVTTYDISDYSYTTATFFGWSNSDAYYPVTERGFCYSSSVTEPNVDNATKVTCSLDDDYHLSEGMFKYYATDLSSGVTYYVRAYATNSVGTTYGVVKSFTTNAYQVPVVSTYDVTDISYTTASCGGYISSDKGSSITERGVCYSTSPSPTIADEKMLSTSTSNYFYCNMTDLNPGTTYYIRAYAINSEGAGYGEEKTFTTVDYKVPTVTTTTASYISFTSAICGGTITDNGSLSIESRGVCYATHSNPSIMDYTADGNASDKFTCGLIDLEDNVTYYYRAYASNAKGVGYGDIKSFTTVDSVSATVYYEAPQKLAESKYDDYFESGCIRVNAFGSTLLSHEFENGVGKLIFSEKVTTIGNSAFRECTTLTSVTLPYTVTEIQEAAFANCDALVTFEIPKNVTKLGHQILAECDNLQSITVEDGNQYFCSVDGVLFSKDMKLLKQFPFGKKPVSYTVPNTVTSIEYSNFRYITSLVSITLPPGLTEVGDWLFYECTSLESIVIPDNVTGLGTQALSRCTALKTIVIGSSVDYLNSNCLAGCKNLESITCKALVPPTCNTYWSNVFEEIDKSIPVYVPAASVNAYKSKEVWKNFTNILPIP